MTTMQGLYLGRLSFMCLLLCTADAEATNTTTSSISASGKFLWFSDVHLDLYYGRPSAAWHFADSPCGGTATGGLPAPRIDGEEGRLEFPYSHFGCGSTAALVRSALQAARRVFAQPSATAVATSSTNSANIANTDDKDVPLQETEAKAEAEAQHALLPDFIIFSGDSTRHFADVTPDADATVSESIRFVYDATREAFGDGIPIVQLPSLALGNNDMPNGDYVLDVTSYEPCLVQVDEDDGDGELQLPVATNAWLKQASEIIPWAFANDVERSTFACGGYVEREIALPLSSSTTGSTKEQQQKLRIIVLNTVVYSKKLVSDPPLADPTVDDPFGQLAWMQSRLEAARRDGVKVYLTGHIPPIQESYVYSIGHRFWNPPFVMRYYALVKEYKDVVAAHLYGHTHVNELRHIPLLDEEAAPLLVQSAISPGLGNLPTFSVASYDNRGHSQSSTSMRVTDLAKWTVEYNPKTETWPTNDADDADVAAGSGAGGLVWKAQVPSVLHYFDMGGLANGDVLDLARRMSTTPALFVKYWNYFTKGHPYVVGPCLKEPCPREEICVVMCGVTDEMWSACVGEGAGESAIPLSDYSCADAVLVDDGGVDGDPFPTTTASLDVSTSSAREFGAFDNFLCYILMCVPLLFFVTTYL